MGSKYRVIEGLATYWRGQRIMEETATKKIEKRFTPFAYKRTISNALSEVFRRFRHSAIVLSYSSNSIPGEQEIYELLRSQKQHVEFFAVPHRYSFGTHATARRREVQEYIFVAQ